jgi:DNA-binding transcriptional ArsR family regulator
MKNEDTQYGWGITRSIALELDAALAIASGYLVSARVTPELMSLHRSVPEDWRKEWLTIQQPVNWFNAVMEYSALLSGVLEEGDYSRATMMIRETTPDQAINYLKEQAKNLQTDKQIFSGENFSIPDQFVDFRNQVFRSVGFESCGDVGFQNRTANEIKYCLSILNGGSNHNKFWHLLDRFYYEVYSPWREERRDYLDELESKLIAALGTLQSIQKPVNLQWLPGTNPALRYPELNHAISSGQIYVKFWLEPFGFADYWTLTPGKLIVSFAEPGKMYENFRAVAENLASRANALGDPTRLIILRMIRELSMTNTDMAKYLHLSRPTVSIHARILREAGLVRSWDDGRITRHAIIPDAVRALFLELAEFLDLPPENNPPD